MPRVKLYAGDDYTWGFNAKNVLTPMLTDAGNAKLQPLYGPQGRSAVMTPGGDTADPREHIIIETTP